MMKNHLFVIFGFLLFVSSCGSKKSVNNDNSETQEVESLILEYYEVMSARNWPAYREFFSEKAILTTVWQDSTEANPQIFSNTISGFLAQTSSGPDSQPIFEEKPVHIEMEIKNNLAAVWVNYEAKFGSENNLIEWKGYDLFSLIKFEDQWKIASLTYIEIPE